MICEPAVCIVHRAGFLVYALAEAEDTLVPKNTRLWSRRTITEVKPCLSNSTTVHNILADCRTQYQCLILPTPPGGEVVLTLIQMLSIRETIAILLQYTNTRCARLANRPS